MKADTRLPPYLPYPRFLLQADLTQTAKLLYALLLDRVTLSQANGWLDEDGRIYLVFPTEKIAAALDRSPMTVKTALSELEDAGLIVRRRSGFSKPNRIYVKLPPDGQKTFQVTDRNPSSIGIENCLTDGQEIVPMTERKLSPNNLSNSNLNQNHLSRERDAPLHFMELDGNQPNHKRSREAAHRLHCAVNRGAVQSIREDGRYFTNPASIDFSCLILSPFCQKIAVNLACLQSVYSLI